MESMITEKDVAWIIEQVINNVEATIHSKDQKNDEENPLGVFEKVEDAIEAADIAQKEYSAKYSIEDRKRIITSIRNMVLNHVEEIAQKVYEETQIGRQKDKEAKLWLAATLTPGTEDLTTSAISGSYGLTIEEMAPFGVIGAVTPVTNPVETIINNTISMLAGGNSVVFNVHPSSKKCSAYVVGLLNKTILEAGGPNHLITMIKEPTMESLNEIAESPKINILVGTGGSGLVKMLLRSGKKTIGAGAGNPPVIVDETANLENAAKGIIEGASFDNNILCIGEKEVFVLNKVADDLIYHMLQKGAYMLSNKELDKVIEVTLTSEEKQSADYHVNKKWIGRNAEEILRAIGVSKTGVKLLICEVDFHHPYVQLEQMMPILPIVRCATFEEAVENAVKAEHGNKHTASIYSTNVDNMTKFAKEINTTIFVKNAPTLAGVGFKGEGSTTFTIAGPTGEGITSAKTFTRVRRCTLAEGGFRII